jgi:subtilisin
MTAGREGVGMIRPVRVFVVLALVSAGSVSVARADTPKSPYIVVLEDSVDHPGAKAAAHGKALGFQPKYIYRHALKGYAARLTDAAVATLRADHQVAFVEQDETVSLAQTQPPQTVGNGILRIDGDQSSTVSGDGSGSVDVNVAVLDTGIDPTHPI